MSIVNQVEDFRHSLKLKRELPYHRFWNKPPHPKRDYLPQEKWFVEDFPECGNHPVRNKLLLRFQHFPGIHIHLSSSSFSRSTMQLRGGRLQPGELQRSFLRFLAINTQVLKGSCWFVSNLMPNLTQYKIRLNATSNQIHKFVLLIFQNFKAC